MTQSDGYPLEQVAKLGITNKRHNLGLPKYMELKFNHRENRGQINMEDLVQETLASSKKK